MSTQKSEFTILNWNANGFSDKTKITELSTFLEQFSVDVGCITETHLSSKDNLFIRGYTIYRRDRDTPHGGVAIMVKSNIRHRAIRTESLHIEAVGIEIFQPNDKPSLIIISAYSPPLHH